MSVARPWRTEQDKSAVCLALHYADLVRSPVLCHFTPVFSHARVPESGSSRVQTRHGDTLSSSAGVGGSSLMAVWGVGGEGRSSGN